ncbi:MAG: SGNH/GDSL hydrolase family protein [Pirellulales bacterium]
MTRRRHLVCFALVVAAIACWLPAAIADEFFFKDGDTVVMIGDSITEQHLYSNYVEMWTISRFPGRRLVFRNVGIGGDRSPGGNRRFARDVLIHKPTAVTVNFGMNDGSYRAFDEAGFKTYIDGLQGIADQAKAANIRVAWLTCSPVEKNEDGPALTGYNETLERYSAGVSRIAMTNGGAFVDQFHPFLAAQDQARAADPTNRIGGGDPVHPGAPGQALMTWAILKGLNFPSLVSKVSIDASGKLLAAENCEVTDLSVADGEIRFQRHDAALPFFPVEAEAINQWVNVRDDLNRYLLQVTGLETGRYFVLLGGKKVAAHSAAELSEGVNLTQAALMDGPVAEQLQAVWDAVKAKNAYYHDRVFRAVVLAPVHIPDFLGLDVTPQQIESKRLAAVTERMARLPELDAAIRNALEIQPHEVRVIPAPE